MSQYFLYLANPNPPHFHAEYGEYGVLINIDTLAIIGDRLPARALGMATEWASLHQQGLRAAGRGRDSFNRPATLTRYRERREPIGGP